MQFTLVGTGHRPQDISSLGTPFSHAQYIALRATALRGIHRVLRAYKLAPTDLTVVAGGALGWDMALAEAALMVPGVRLHVMLPYASQEQCVARWGHMPNTVARWHRINARAHQLSMLSNPGSFGQQLQARNIAMLNQVQGAGCVLAFWSGKQRGGTFNTISSARKLGLPCHNAFGL